MYLGAIVLVAGREVFECAVVPPQAMIRSDPPRVNASGFSKPPSAATCLTQQFECRLHGIGRNLPEHLSKGVVQHALNLSGPAVPVGATDASSLAYGSENP
jgi:hypothetical protein